MLNATLTESTGIKVIDWNRTEEHARSLSREACWAAYLDCVKTAEHFDAMAREGEPMGADAGYYRDCASVYRRVINEIR